MLKTIIDSFKLQTSWENVVLFTGLLGVAILFYLIWALFVVKKGKLGKQPFSFLDIGVVLILLVWFTSVASKPFNQYCELSSSLLGTACMIYLCLVMGILGFLEWRGISVKKLFGLCDISLLKIASYSFLWLLAVYPLLMLLQGVQGFLFHIPNENQDIVVYFLSHPFWKDRLFVGFIAIFMAPISEEVIFRGYIYGVARRYLGMIPGLLISSFFFALLHSHLPSFAGLMVLGIVLALLYEKTGCLLSNICFHAFFNSISLLLLLVISSHSK